MKIDITTTTIVNGKKSVTTEKNIDKRNDIRIEMLKDIDGCFTSWQILDYDFDYECRQTKYGYKVVKTIRQHKETKETVITEFNYN
jgi:hypothetical protein